MVDLFKEQYEKDYAKFVESNYDKTRKDIVQSLYKFTGYSDIQCKKLYAFCTLVFIILAVYILCIISAAYYSKIGAFGTLFHIVLHCGLLLLSLFGAQELFFKRNLAEVFIKFVMPRKFLLKQFFKNTIASVEVIDKLLEKFPSEQHIAIRQYVTGFGKIAISNGRVKEFLYKPTNQDWYFKNTLSSFSADISGKLKDLEDAKQALLEREQIKSDVPIKQKSNHSVKRL